MINISIKKIDLKLLNFKEEFKILEKVDGTKLNLIRNNTDFSDNWNENWFVCYKGNLIRYFEFEPFEEKIEEIEKQSFGYLQYLIIFNFLKENHSKLKIVPKNTEIFIEFVQDKPTITRTYKKFHDLYFLAFSKCQYYIDNEYDKIISYNSDINWNIYDLLSEDIIKECNIKVPKVLFQGFSNKDDFLPMIKKYMDEESELGGEKEGLVIYNSDNIFKIVQFDQYDKTRREKKKEFYQEKNEFGYWIFIRSKTKEILNSGEKEYPKRIADLYLKTDFKRTEINIREDLLLTTKLNIQLRKSLNFKTIGLLAIAGKPIHQGHWNLIKKSSEENEMTYFIFL